MYSSLINRFRGAFVGSALAECLPFRDGLEPAPLPLTRALIQVGQNSLCASPDQDFGAHGLSADSSGAKTIAQMVVRSLLRFDASIESRQNIPLATGSLGQVLLSESLSLCLQNQPATVVELLRHAQAILPESPDLSALLITLDGAISQRLPLQDATRSIANFPGLDDLDRAIALAVYCWLCTPKWFTIAVQRSDRIDCDGLGPERSLIAAMTGMLVGISTAIIQSPPDLTPRTQDLPHDLIPTADRLFQQWAGISLNPLNDTFSQPVVVTQLGSLKPRSSSHLTLESNYD